ncbi:pyridoxal phosphate-dependent decarboxylase family protein [Saccharothrix longispora]|uniref:pyridoxal phosphate-dependent decarboxylase family protein n=1 Tax=Saccharothrix longispora TaxID=33920 RepID=UPI0028FD53C6|nr:aminotransferase class V-fold PLP-dependent enzyme [Saccharothrix longispora]MDU0288076.1 aminotransferase class V-fold PLP-dependent enzyme [Saccharothrix longispora]
MFAASPSGRPIPAGRPADVLASAIDRLGELPEHGLGANAALARLTEVLAEYDVDLAHPFAAAHLQPPPLAVAVAADALAAAGNASLDTYDSGPAALAVERWVVAALTGLAGFGPGADGVFTPGGTLSNLTALLLARDAAAARLGVDVRSDGVAALPDPVVLCSEAAHFSVQRACAALGIGEHAVRPVAVDPLRRMRPDALDSQLRSGGTPVAVVATAGTTDFGSVDPLHEVAEVAREHGAWLHVDAAYGFGALFSAKLAGLVDGLSLADSVTADLHKIGWQPASASVLLVRSAASFGALERSVAYLNPEDDRAEGYDGTLGRTLQTTRRADAVKVAATLLALGRAGLGALVDRCHELARHAAGLIAADPAFELVGGATLTTVVFRYRTADESRSDEVNARLRRRLLRSGEALIGRTEVDKATCLKFTLLNPNAREADLVALLALVREAGSAAERLLEGVA